MPTRHYFVFNNAQECAALDKEAWDFLRTGTDNPAFQFESSVEEYDANCARREDCQKIAGLIRDTLAKLEQNVSHIVSLGAGKGIVEWHLKRMLPELPITCTDYAESSVVKLGQLFLQCDKTLVFDMLAGDYGRFGKDAVLLMNRVSTEFTPSQWRSIFRSCSAAGIKHILFVPTELASLRLKAMETVCHILRRILRRQDTFCGWLYSKRELESLMSLYYRIDSMMKIGETAVYNLRSRG